MLAFGMSAAAFVGLRGSGHPWLPGIAAIVAGVLGLLLGAIATTWGTAALLALACGAIAAAAARAFHFLWLPIAVLAASIGLFFGVTRLSKLHVVLPPLFAAAFAALGLAIGWAPHWRGAALWQLNDVDWVLGLFVVLAIPLTALALQRERRRKATLEARTPALDDADLKKAIAALQRAGRGE